MDYKIEGENQKLVREHLCQGYELVHNEITIYGMIYLMGREIALSDKIDIVVIKQGQVTFNGKLTQSQIEMLAGSIKNKVQ